MKLPEKEWLTLEEVAERWRTDVDRIEHYLITGTLKPCLRQGRELLQIENYHDMQWDWSHMADDSFCDLAKCKIQLTCKDSDAVRWSGDPKVCEDDLLIALNEVQRFEKACNADTDSYFEAKRLRKQQIDVLPSVLGVRSASSIASSDLGSAKQDSELDVSADIPRQAAGHNIADVPVESLVVPLAPPAEEVEQGCMENDNRNKGGRPLGFLTEALEYAYQECLNRGDTSILEPGQLQAFLKHLQKLAGGSRNKDSVSEYIQERVDVVQPLNQLECIKTQDQERKRGTYKKGRWYSQVDVSTRMNSIRRKYPLLQ